jgi:glycosyltransferase involved in cell wall biosynthesis
VKRSTHPAKETVLVVGPGLGQVGGVATFIDILATSPVIAEKYRILRLDTTRFAQDLGLENRLSPTNVGYLLRQIIQFIAIILREKPGLIHIQVTSGLAFWKAGVFILLGKIFGAGTVAHLHGGMFDKYYAACRPSTKKWIGRIFASSDMVVALSEKWRQFLLAEVRGDLRVEIASNPVDRLFAEALEAGGSASDVRKKDILFLGSLGKRKGVFDILQAAPAIFEKHPDARIVFAGAEESRGEKLRIDELCREKQLDEKVTFIGVVTGKEKVSVFQNAMIYVLPSYGENLPFSLLEAMSLGLPVVTTPVGAIPEIVKDGENGFLVEPGNIRALASCVDRLLSDEPLRRAISDANRAKIKTDFMPDDAMRQIDLVYSRVLQGIRAG